MQTPAMTVTAARWCILLLATLLASCAQPPEAPRSTALVLHDVTVIDGTGAPARPHQVLMLDGGRITAMGDVASLPIPEGAHVLPLDGTYVVPGFVDLHVHLPGDGPGAEPIQRAILAQLLDYGVTTILNPGARPGAGVALRERLRHGELRGPRLFTAGPIIDFAQSAPDGQPLPPGNPGTDLGPWAHRVADRAAIQQEVREQAARGVDWIKLYAQLPPELVAAAVEQAHALGLPVLGHMGATGWGEAARLGVDMLVHSGWGTPMDELVDLPDPDAASDAEWYAAWADAPNGERLPALARILVEHDVVVVPTLSITQASGLGADATLLPEFRTDLAPDAHLAHWWTDGWQERHPQYDPDSAEEAQLLATVYVPGALGILRAWYEQGVRLGVGTDVGNSWMTPGFIYHHELALYQQAGIPPLAILRMATHDGAQALGILDDTGTLQVGKRADLVLLGSDPSVDIRNTLDIQAVFQRGVLTTGGPPTP
jgi:imidazolonepropionase-like amidohydrolase